MILQLDVSVAILASASVAILYTMFGHMIAVAYTDVLQLILIVAGLVSDIRALHADHTHTHTHTHMRLQHTCSHAHTRKHNTHTHTYASTCITHAYTHTHLLGGSVANPEQAKTF